MLDLARHTLFSLACAALAWTVLSPVLAHHAVYDDVFVLSSPDLHSSWADFWQRTAWQNDCWGSRLNSASSHQQWRPASVASLRLSLFLRPQCAALDAGRELLASRDNCSAPPHPCLVAIHADTLLLHCLCTALLYFVAVGPLGRHYWEALGAAALFAIHPVHAESVATVYGRADVQALASHMLALLAAWAGLRSSSRQWLLIFMSCTASLLCSAGAALSKENGLVACLALPLADALLWKAARRHTRLLFATVCFAAVMGSLYARSILLVPWGPPTGFVDNSAAWLIDRRARIASLSWLNVRYLEMLIFPWLQSVNHGWDSGTLILPPALDDPRTLAAAFVYSIAVGALAVMARAAWTGTPLPLFLALWGLLCFAPAANIAFIVGTTISERLLYLPSAPFCLLVATSASHLPGRSVKAVAVLATPLLIAFLAARVRSEIAVYRCEEMLWAATIKRYPRNVLALNNLAVRHDGAGRHAEALALYDAIDKAWADGQASGESQMFSGPGAEPLWGPDYGVRRSSRSRARVLRPLVSAAAVDPGWSGGSSSSVPTTSEDAITALKSYSEAFQAQPDAALGMRILGRLQAICRVWDTAGHVPLCVQVLTSQ